MMLGKYTKERLVRNQAEVHIGNSLSRFFCKGLGLAPEELCILLRVFCAEKIQTNDQKPDSQCLCSRICMIVVTNLLELNTHF